MSRRSGARHPTAKLKGGWSPEEDAMLARLVKKFGEGNWSPIARALNEATGKTETTGRIGKQCRERWNHHLSPGLRKDPWTPEEEVMVVDAHKRLGNRWSDIARCIPGRSENAVKNHWNATLRKRVTPDNPAGPLKEYLDTLNLCVTPRKRGSSGGGGGVKRKRCGSRDSDCTSDEAEPDMDTPHATPTPDSRATSPSRAWMAAAAATTAATAATLTKSRARSGVTAPVAALAIANIATAPGGRGGGGARVAAAAVVPGVAVTTAPAATTTASAGPSIRTPVRREVAAVAAAFVDRVAAAAAAVDMYDHGSISTAARMGGVSARRRSRRLAAQVGTERLRNMVEAERREKEEEAAELAEYDNGVGDDDGRSESKSSKADAEVEMAAAPVSSRGAGVVLAVPQEPTGCQGGPSQTESICGSALPTQIAGSGAAVAGVGPPTPATAEREIPVAARPVGSSPFSRGAVRAAIVAGGLSYMGFGSEPSTAGSAMLPPEAAAAKLPVLARLPVLPPLRPVAAPPAAAVGAAGSVSAAEREPSSPLHGAAGCGASRWSFPYNWSTNNIQILATEEILPRVALGTPRGGKVRPPAANGTIDTETEGAVEAATADAMAKAGAVQQSSGCGAAAGDAVHTAGVPSAADQGAAAAAAAAVMTVTATAAAAVPLEPSSSCPPPLCPSAEEDETCLFLTPAADFSASMCHMRHVASGSALLSYETAAVAQPPAAAAVVAEQSPQHCHPHPSHQQYHQSPFATAAADNTVLSPVACNGGDAGNGEAAAPVAAANARTGAAAAGASCGGDGAGACAFQAPCPYQWTPRLAVAVPPVRTWTPPNLFDEPHLDFGCPDSPLLDAGDAADADAGVALSEDEKAGADDAAVVAAAAAAGIACDSGISSVGSPLSHVREYGDSGAFAQQEVTEFFWGSRAGASGGGAAAAAAAAVGAGTGGGEGIGPPAYMGSTTVSPVAASGVLKRESSFSGCSFVPPPALGCAPPQQQQQQQQQLPSAPHHAPAVCHPSSPWGSKGVAVQPLPTAPASPSGWPSAMPPPAAAAVATTAPPVQASYVIGHPVLPPQYMWHAGVPMPPPPSATATSTAPPLPLHPHPHYGMYGGLPFLPPGTSQPLHPHAAGAALPPYPFLQGSLPPANAQPGSGQQQQQLPQPQQPNLCRQEPPVPFPPLAHTRAEDGRQQQRQQQAPMTVEYPEYGTSYVVAPGPFYYSWAPYPYGGVPGCMSYHATPAQVTGVPMAQAQPPAAPLEHAHRLAMQPQPAPQPQNTSMAVGSFTGVVAAVPSAVDLPRLSCTTVPQVAE